ncbi:hypothetical protein ACO0LF_02840 [Undibacterium sp. Di27W]|uniref:hypothetical protein n=1 Tax=Undibacterium sp. Di27W TaxID=3413036 RepID=UPI003BF2F12C
MKKFVLPIICFSTIGLLIVVSSAIFMGKQVFIHRDVETKVTALIDEMTTSPSRQERAFLGLQELSEEAIPYLVGHLDDMRPLAVPEVHLVNKAPGAFERTAHYGPVVVHDGLSLVLAQLTKRHVIVGYGVSTRQDREKNRDEWMDWCKLTYPAKIKECGFPDLNIPKY